MNAIVSVIGEGRLAELVSGQLSPLFRVIRQADFEPEVSNDARLALVLDDGWRPSVHHKAEQALQAAGIPWLRGFVAFGEGIAGPLVRPGEPGCSQCADLRLLMAGRDRKEMAGLQRRLEEAGGVPEDAWATRPGLLQLATLIAEEAKTVLSGDREPLTKERIMLLNMKTLQSSRHFFLPDPLCPVCGRLPDDSPEAARISLRPAPKASAGSYRSRPMSELKKVLSRDYLDYRSGFLNGKRIDIVSPFADASVNLPLFSGDEATAGRTHCYEDSESTAILEGLERYCGLMPRGKRTVVHDSFSRLREHALHPVRVGVHAPEQYAQPDFPYKPFDPERPMNWVWGYSFLQERPILVPEQLAYYSLGGGEGFVYETSNGCALGGSLEEAILFGLMEVVERDSFLLTWYAQLPLPRLDPDSAGDTELLLMTRRLQALTGYELRMYNSTMEHGIPCVWVTAVNQKKKGMNLICAAGAHPDPVRAVKSAVHELAGMLLTMDGKLESNRAAYERMLRDSSLVREMDDHSMLYGLPEAQKRLRFLLDDRRPARSFAEQFKPRAVHADLSDDLRDMVESFRRLKLEVIVVDQTTPELQRNGLHCVKVLVPGMLPMTFGYHLTRLTGLDRVLNVPCELGYAKRPLTPEQLNPYPHPFP